MQLFEDLSKNFKTHRECAKFLGISKDYWCSLRHQRLPLTRRLRDLFQYKLEELQQKKTTKRDKKPRRSHEH